MLESLLFTKKQDDGTYLWTLATWTGKFLADIENRFGPRNHEFSFVGVEIDETPKANPCNWFPSSGISPCDHENRSRYAVIRLTPKALESRENAKWQLAHECVHLLDPWNKQVDGRPTNVLEEGLATWYQNFAAPCSLKSDVPSYVEAESLVKQHIDELQIAVKQIRLDHGVRIGEIPPDMLAKFCPSIHEAIVGRLCDRFIRDE